ncbi:MAG TPA: anthranilate synthase component I family protein [Mycobacteriales bacterium]|nr:anthranilate synthase component I family protein [Mycobacteriales bacterium]
MPASLRGGAVMSQDGWAVVDGRLLTGLVDVTDDPAALDSAGLWVVVMTFEGRLQCLRFAEGQPLDDWYDAAPPWHPPAASQWVSTLPRESYVAGVRTIRERIAAGDVYQVNLCRVLSCAMDPDPRALGAALARGNPAPYAATVSVPDLGLHVACASPELSLRRDGRQVAAGPIKGTGATPADLTAKDAAENVMIVDLVRNDLGRVAETGSVAVTGLLRQERHPGLVHLVSTVEAELRDGLGWADLLAATMPAGSVSGAPKAAALEIIRSLEPEPRGVYCGAVGWVDADATRGVLAVAIRTFEWQEGRLRLGTGAGITWGSDPDREWDETRLKTSRLLEVR